MDDMCLVEKGGTGFYAPIDQAGAWSAQGYAVYAMRAVPLNDVAREDGGAEEASCETRRPARPEEEEVG
ncbi:hypothetical protein VJ923_07335 [Adlercreutzia sp. R25]|uniref:hypothetical protein n=1 Tax=Adlercreutzia shanghongiae TaxID=3111773 RepID=UPI002DBCEA80|nr:hypothetical protein [Adlercreutzia sp. R25]MEC4272967.1 hypothetical protein [Adlercreutzia sp. R25]